MGTIFETQTAISTVSHESVLTAASRDYSVSGRAVFANLFATTSYGARRSRLPNSNRFFPT